MRGATDQIVVSGSARTIVYAVREGGEMPAKAFYDSLSDTDKTKILALFKRMADHGQIHNRRRFKKLRGSTYEFKCGQIRVACFQEGRNWVLASGIRKKADKWKPSDIAKAEAIREEHLSRREKQGRERR